MTTYTTRNDAIEREIIGSLGEYGTDYDIEGLADEVLEWVTAYDDAGNELLNSAGYALREDVDFWEAAARHDRAAQLEAAAVAYELARDERRRLVVEAVRSGMEKKRAASLARVSRVTLDRWLTRS